MVQLEKRRLIWSLFTASEEVLSTLSVRHGKSSTIEMALLLDILGSLGYDVRSDSLTEILRLSLIDGNQSLDISLLFHVIGEAVRKVRDRNLMFWNTVITVSSSTIAWVDFRRKLSRWLSSNDLNVSQVKIVLLYAQERLDRGNTGVVRKEDFMSFCEEIMGVDCLLSPDITVLSTMAPVRRLRMNPRSVVAADIMPLSSRPSQPKPIPVPIVELHSVARVPVKSAANELENDMKKRDELASLRLIRARLGSQAIVRFFHSRMRLVFLMYNLGRGLNQEKNAVSVPNDIRESGRARLLVSVVRSIVIRTMMKTWGDLKTSIAPCSLVDANDEAPDINDDIASGPSWTVTIQAVAVVNLICVLRVALTRLKLFGYLTIRTGHCLDENYSLRMVSWSQSKQGRKDAQDANERVILQTIQENSENRENRFEFDLSS
jgi:hypothetical protein